jgi:lipid-A-disaccharide synthase
MSVGEGPLRLMLVAGEPSGDALGAQLMASLKELRPSGLSFTPGVGGPLMEAQGLTSLHPLADTSVMGLKEVVPRIPLILRRVRETANYAIKTRPDLVVLIDSPDFTHRIARRLKRLAPDLVIVKYVAPQVWASRPWRAKKLAEFVDYLLALLPFEPRFFERYGLKTYFVGHPVVERAPTAASDAPRDFRARHGIAQDVPLLALLPGSRFNELRFLWPVFSDVVRRLGAEMPGLQVVIATLPHLRARLTEDAKALGVPVTIIEGEEEKFAAFRAATAALAASGTISTELALAGTPMVIGYKVGWLTEFFAKILMTAKFATLINLVLDEEVIPEFLMDRCTSDALLGALVPLMTSEEARRAQTKRAQVALAEFKGGGEKPSRRAAKALLEIAEKAEAAGRPLSGAATAARG